VDPPKLALNAAAYSLDQPLSDGRTSVARAIPTFSVDSGAVFERESRWFGRTQFQTLEPRLLYANTPYRAQSTLRSSTPRRTTSTPCRPIGRNLFSGIDRVADGHQLTAGVTTRLLDADTGAENLRLGISQRYLFRDQLVTPDGVPLTQRSPTCCSRLDGGGARLAVRGGAALQRRDQPGAAVDHRRALPAGPFHALSATYRFARGLSSNRAGLAVAGLPRQRIERRQLALPGIALRGRPRELQPARQPRHRFDRRGRVRRRMLDRPHRRRRLSTGRSEATTRLLIQLELVGLSRLGTNPLKVLKDNIPGYRLLRDERSGPYEPVVND